MNMKIQHKLGILFSLVVKSRREQEEKKKKKLRDTAEKMLKTTKYLYCQEKQQQQQKHKAMWESKEEEEMKEKTRYLSVVLLRQMGEAWGQEQIWWQKSKHEWVLGKIKADLINILVEKVNEMCV